MPSVLTPPIARPFIARLADNHMVGNNGHEVMDIDTPSISTYSTKDGLARRLSKLDLTGVKFVRVCNSSGRHTIIILGFHQHLLNQGFMMVHTG